MVFDAISTGAAPVSPAIKKTLTASILKIVQKCVNLYVIGSNPIGYLLIPVAQVVEP